MLFSSLKTMQVIALTTVTAFSTYAIAQDRGGGRQGGGFSSWMSANGMTPDYMLRDLQRFQSALDLTDEQTLIVEQILRDYDESFREASDSSQEGMRSSMSAMRPSEDDPARQLTQDLRTRSREIRDKIDSARTLDNENGMQELQAKLQTELDSIRDEMREARLVEWQSPERQTAFEEMALLMQDQLRLKKQMCTEFEGDLVAILTEDQQGLWPPLQRQLVRDRLLPRGRLSGETVDVMGLVEQQDFEDEVLITLLPVLNEWDETVTNALSARDNHMTENQGALMTSMRTMDTSSGADVMKAQAKLAEAVRDINDMAVDNIVLLLPEIQNTEFSTYARERGYPRIYRPTRTDRAYKAAMELEGLEPDILQAIMELYDALQLEMIYANERILEATHRWEAQEQLDRMNRFSARMTGGSTERVESPIRKAEEDRRTIEDNYLEQLRMLLTEEQIEALGGLETREQRQVDRNSWRDSGRNRDSGHSGGFEGGREAFMNRFDADGDGTISESEREAIRDHFRGGGSQGGGNTGSRGGQGSGSGGGQGGGGGGRP